MKKLFVLTVALLSVVMQAEAGQIDEQQAREKAKSFMEKRPLTRGVRTLQRVFVPLATASAMESVNDAPLYIFNFDGGGYVVVSGDDRTAEILAFSEHGHIDAAKMPINMKHWLDGYVKKIQKLPAHVQPQQRALTRTQKAPLEPKLKTAWGQDWPYNIHAPELLVRYMDMEQKVNAATGCVATSMAQLLNYYRYPNATLTGVQSYQGIAGVPVMLDGDESPRDTVQVAWTTEAMQKGAVIDWVNITDTYGENSTETQVEAVSRLMQYCGLAAHMQYGMESSARTDSLVYALYETFGYKDVYLIHQWNYDAQGWADALYDVIAQEGPLLFGGDCPDGSGGHQFILDGYKNVDGNDYFYANWGWDGDDDGYVALDVMRPGWLFDDYGNEIGFTESQLATPGMGPNGKGIAATDMRWYCDYILTGYDDMVYERQKESDGFEVEYAFYFSNYDFPHVTFIPALGIYQNGVLVSGMTFMNESGYDLPLWHYLTFESSDEYPTMPIGSGLGDGVYQIKMLCSVAGAEWNSLDWKTCRDGEDINLVTMTIKGNKATFVYASDPEPPSGIKAVSNQTEMQQGDWHSLSGIRLNGAPSAKGIYIHNGRKVVIK